MGSLFKALMSENIINNKMIENGRPVITDAVCKLLRPPAIVIATEIAPISSPHRTLCFKVGLIEPPVAIPATICVVESALVTIKMKISTIAKELVTSDNGKCDNNSNKATV